MATRRTFIHQAALISAGVFANPACLFSRQSHRVGLQLYTLRNEIDGNVEKTLSKVAEIGFTEVETFGYSRKNGFWGYDISSFRKLLKRYNLQSPSGHYDFDSYFRENNEDVLKSYIEAARGIGQQYITVPYLNPLLRTSLDNYKMLAGKLNNAAILVKKAGMQLAYHNHDFEFKDFGGRSGYDILLSETDPSNVKFELDIYWTVKAGKDPLALFEQNPGRFVMWHVKDMNKSDKTFTEVGTGSINYKEIFGKAKLSGMKHFMIEQDVIKMDPFESIKKSYQYVNSLL